ncbi:MAG TPA: tetratricopeptide repeat protein, partial [Anaerolineae bacterium]|nr:tetratricopeptide repeat protein [Anaerolineae bacterium]
MLLDKKKVGMVTKVGAVIIALAFIVVYIPMISQIIPGSGGDQTSSQPQTDAQVAATIAAFEQAAQKNPKDANAWIKLGNAYGDQKIYDKAIESYSKALELDPKNV